MQSLIDPHDVAGDEARTAALQSMIRTGTAPPMGSPARKAYEASAVRARDRKDGMSEAQITKKMLKAAAPRSPQASAMDSLTGIVPAGPGPGSGSDLHNFSRQAAIARGDAGNSAQQRLLDRRSPTGASLMNGELETDSRTADHDPRNAHQSAVQKSLDATDFDAKLSGAQSGINRTLAALTNFERERATVKALKDPLVVKALAKATKKAANKGRAATSADVDAAYAKLRAKAMRPSVPKAPDLTPVNMKGPTSAVGMAGTSGLAGAVERPAFPGAVAKATSPNPGMEKRLRAADKVARIIQRELS